MLLTFFSSFLYSFSSRKLEKVILILMEIISNNKTSHVQCPGKIPHSVACTHILRRVFCSEFFLIIFFPHFFMALLFEFCSITLHYIYMYIYYFVLCMLWKYSEHWVNKQSLKNCCNIKAVRCWLYFLCIVFFCFSYSK